MAVYKVIQDVEAEDKVLGPLSLKQLIYAAIAGGIVFLAFRVATTAGTIYAAIPFVPFVALFILLAAPFNRDQPTEMWIAAQVRFRTQPRKKIWDQDGIKELVHITAPKKVERQYTDGLSQGQVRSRLNALALTMDTRGQAIMNAHDEADASTLASDNSDRIIQSPTISPSSQPQDQPDDIMDAGSSKVAQNIEGLITTSTSNKHAELLAKTQENAKKQSQQASQPADTAKSEPQATAAAQEPAASTADQDTATASAQATQQQTAQDNQASPNSANKTTKASSKDFDFIDATDKKAKDQPPAPDQAKFQEEAVVKPNDEDTFLKTNSAPPASEDELKLLNQAKQKHQIDTRQFSGHHKAIKTPEQIAQEENEKRAKKEAELAIKRQAEAEAKAKAEAEAARIAAEEAQKHQLSEADRNELANSDDVKVSTIASLADYKTSEKPAGEAPKEPEEVVIDLH